MKKKRRRRRREGDCFDFKKYRKSKKTSKIYQDDRNRSHKKEPIATQSMVI
jgi:hypothetical protein